MKTGKERNRLWLTAVMLGIAMTAIAAVQPAYAAQYTTIQLTSNFHDDMDPLINNSGQVVWVGFDFPWDDQEIFLYDGTAVIQLTNNQLDDWYPQINNSGQVVWSGWEGWSGGGWEIHLFDIAAGTTTNISNRDGKDNRPQINDSGQVVWEGWDGPDLDIFLYDGTAVIQLTNNAYHDINPQINNSGQVVWEGGEGTDSDIFLYDGTAVIQLTNNAYHDSKHQINDSGQVVWEGRDGTDPATWEIYLYDIAAGTTTNISNNAYLDIEPQINDSGQVVWEGRDGTDPATSEIYLYDIAAGTTTNISNHAYRDTNPQINDSGQVVWRGRGDWSTDIFLYDGTSATQLTNNTTTDVYPQINNSGQVVWQRDDVNDWEIFLATPAGTTQTGTDVVVQPEDPTTGTNQVTITFDDVTGSGETTVTTSGTGAPPPSGFKLGAPPTYYEISTTASSTGQILVCINYSGISYGNESALKLMHHEDTDGDGIGDQWVDVTCDPTVDAGCPDPNPDTVNDVICGIVSSLSTFAIFEPNPLIGLYRFNGNGNDDSGYGNHGTVFGGATYTTAKDGTPNGAIVMDGVDDYVELPNESTFDLDELTIMATIKVPDYLQENWLISKGFYFGNYTLRINDSQTTWPGYARYNHQISPANWVSLASDDPVPTGEFFNIAVTLSPTEFNAYINGELMKTVLNPPAPFLNNEPVTIGGGGYYSLIAFFKGVIDEVRIYNVALSAAEVRDLGELITILRETMDAINNLEPVVLKNSNIANTLTNKINAVLPMIDQRQYREALDKLENDILKKTDGCANSRAPDKNDWIKDCTVQAQVYPLIMEAINLLLTLI